MPANLTPEYKAAEASFRRARDPEDRLHWLREMLRTIPKHKGTDHLQADIRTRIKELSDELAAGPRKGAARTGPVTVIRPEGAAQIALLGPPNSGKSALHDRLTGSHSPSGPAPFTTLMPHPGMLRHQDVAFQLVDLPSVSSRHPVPWIGNALQPADGALLVVDLADPGCVDDVADLRQLLAQRRVTLGGSWPAEQADQMEDDDPFSIVLPAALVVTKSDLLPDPTAEVEVFGELSGIDFPLLVVSAQSGEGLEGIAPWLFDRVGVVRVYTKVPGKPPDMSRPFTIRRGQTVLDVATMIHKDVAASLRYARLWGRGGPEGQQIGREHRLEDGAIVELH